MYKHGSILAWSNVAQRKDRLADGSRRFPMFPALHLLACTLARTGKHETLDELQHHATRRLRVIVS